MMNVNDEWESQYSASLRGTKQSRFYDKMINDERESQYSASLRAIAKQSLFSLGSAQVVFIKTGFACYLQVEPPRIERPRQNLGLTVEMT